MSGFDTRAAAALADPLLKTAVERTAGTAEAKRTLAVRLGDLPARILFSVLLASAYGVLEPFALLFQWAPAVYGTLLISAPVILIVLLARTAGELVLALKLTSLAALLTGLGLAAAIAF